MKHQNLSTSLLKFAHVYYAKNLINIYEETNRTYKCPTYIKFLVNDILSDTEVNILKYPPITKDIFRFRFSIIK